MNTERNKHVPQVGLDLAFFPRLHLNAPSLFIKVQLSKLQANKLIYYSVCVHFSHVRLRSGILSFVPWPHLAAQTLIHSFSFSEIL